jgi:formate-dependent phosphoribosylglycinamide formyltransferase (GAR transformylase)
VELFVKGEQVWFSEVSPRPHDTGLVTLCTQHQSELLHARAILGLPVDTSLRNPGASADLRRRGGRGHRSTASMKHCACRAPICACSASPSFAAAHGRGAGACG